MSITFQEFREQMIVIAKEIQGDNYPGDEYYMQDDECWRQPFEQGESPADAVR